MSNQLGSINQFLRQMNCRYLDRMIESKYKSKLQDSLEGPKSSERMGQAEDEQLDEISSEEKTSESKEDTYLTLIQSYLDEKNMVWSGLGEYHQQMDVDHFYLR